MKRVLFALLTVWARVRGRPAPYRTVSCADFPSEAGSRALYVVGEGEQRWFAALACPCGCGDLIQLSLLETGNPRWRLRAHWNGTVSLHPSIWRTRGCHAHFFLRKSEIRWCPPLPPQRFPSWT